MLIPGSIEMTEGLGRERRSADERKERVKLLRERRRGLAARRRGRPLQELLRTGAAVAPAFAPGAAAPGEPFLAPEEEGPGLGTVAVIGGILLVVGGGIFLATRKR